MGVTMETGDILIIGGKTFVSMEHYNKLQKELKRETKILEIMIEEREYLKSVIENKNKMRII